MAPPFAVVAFENKSGSESYRVTGSWRGKRIRKNFAQRANAESFCNAKNAEALQAVGAGGMWLVQTRLHERDVRAAEGAFDRLNDRWSLREVLEAGIEALTSRPAAQPVGPLAEEWLLMVEDEVEKRWFRDLRARVRRFVRENPKLTTAEWDRAFTRKWLDGLPLAKQSKANMRNAVHRFGNWLVERGSCKDNPAAGIRITGRMTGAKRAEQAPPSIFTPAQADALLWACQLGSCRRLLGWMATCLFTGLRPESEAPRATWAEVNLKTREFSVMGRKRGAKPRIVKLTDTAVAWLKVIKADAMEKPALYSRRLKTRAVELANARLAELHLNEKPIVWDEDITRHTFASYRSPQLPVHQLAEEMGTSAGMIYGHYRHPRPGAEVKAFWVIHPSLSHLVST